MHVVDRPIALSELLAGFPSASCGAMATFTGFVRDHDGGRGVKSLFYDCYRPLAEKTIADLILRARSRWPVDEARVLHRVGNLAIGEIAVAIAVSAAHRDEAFAACRFLIEEIKHRVPVWKKQLFEDGTEEWVFCRHAETEPTCAA